MVLRLILTAAVAQCSRPFASQAEGWFFECQPQQTLVVKTGSDCSFAKRSAIEVSRVLGDIHYKRMPRFTVGVARERTLSLSDTRPG